MPWTRDLELSKALVESIPGIAWLSRTDATLEYANQRTFDALDLTQSEADRSQWEHLLHPNDHARVNREWRHAIASETPFESEYRLRMRDATYRWHLGRARPIRSRDGEVVRWVGTASDIDALKQAQQVAEASRRQTDELLKVLDTFQEASPVGFALLSTELQYVRINQTLAAMNGLSVEDHIGRRVVDALPSFWAYAEPFLRRVLDTQEPIRNVDFTVPQPDSTGELYHWLVNLYPIHVNSGLIGVGMVTVDVTERRRLEEQLRQSQRMEATGRLAGGVAHDFNNLLTTILGYTDLASAAVTDDVVKTYLAEVKNAGDIAAGVTSQLLTFSRREVVSDGTVEPAAALRTMTRMLQQAVGESIAIRLDVPERTSSVGLDDTRFKQVVLNLVVNARDAMPSGGAVTLTCVEVDVPTAFETRELPRGRYARLSIADTGTGMAADIQSKIFEPFFTTKAVGRGTGLGLSTVYGIVTQARGTVTVHSELGRGTTFHIYLPSLATRHEPTDIEANAPDTLAGSETILLVEDDDSVRALTHQTLLGQGYTVLTASNPTEALALEEAYPRDIDLLITDVAMPRADGRHLAAILRARRRALRVLYISGYAPTTLGDDAALVPGHNFLPKPFSPVIFLSAVRQSLTTEPERDG